MRSIEINLASRPFRNNLYFQLGTGTAVVLLILFTAYNAVTLTRHSRTVATLDAEMADGRAQMEALETEAESLRREIATKDLKDLRIRINAANEILLERDFNWTRLLNALEEAQPYKVRLVDLRPTVSSKGVLIQARGIARDLENFFLMQEHLQEHPMFQRVYPGGYSRGPEGGEVFFNISFNYFPDPGDAPPPGEPAALTPETAGSGPEEDDEEEEADGDDADFEEPPGGSPPPPAATPPGRTATAPILTPAPAPPPPAAGASPAPAGPPAAGASSPEDLAKKRQQLLQERRRRMFPHGRPGDSGERRGPRPGEKPDEDTDE